MILKWLVVIFLFLQICFIARVDGTCSGHQYITANYAGFISSPNYDTGDYETNLNCSWHIEGSSNGMYLHYKRIAIDCSDSFTVYEGCDDTGTLWTPNSCGALISKSNYVSGGSIYAAFLSDNTTTARGFGLYYTSGSPENVGTACSGGYSLTANSTAQYFTSPNFPNKYPLSQDCYWNITAEDGKKVKLEVLFVDVEADNCQYDYLHITNGDGLELDKLCVTNSWQLRTYVNESISVYLKSDNDENRNGFVISFITLEEETTTQVSLTTTTQAAECNYPLAWQTNTMNDSVEGTVNFTATTFSGWTVKSFGDSVSEWTCYEKIGNLIISRSINKVQSLDDYYIYMCLKIISIENNVYNYKLISVKNSDSFNARVVPITISTTPSFPSGCNEEEHNETRTLTVKVEETTTEQVTSTQTETTTAGEITTQTDTTTKQVTTTQAETNTAGESTTQTDTTTKQVITTQAETTTAGETTTQTDTTTKQETTTKSDSTTETQECNYPAALQTNTVTDSVEGIVNFTARTLSGWTETSFNVEVSEWTCYKRSGNLIISRSLNQVQSLDDYYIYVCLQIINTDNNVYTYKLISAKNSDSMNARVVPIPISTTPSFPSSCNNEDHNDTRTLTIQVDETTTTDTETTTLQRTTSDISSTAMSETTITTKSTTISQTTTGIFSTTETETTKNTEIPTNSFSTTIAETTTELTSRAKLETTTDPLSTTKTETTTDPLSTTKTETATTTDPLSTTKTETTTGFLSTTKTETTKTTHPLSTTKTETTTTTDPLSTTKTETTTGFLSTTKSETTTDSLSTANTKTTKGSSSLTISLTDQASTTNIDTTTTLPSTNTETTTESLSTTKTETTTYSPSTTEMETTTDKDSTTQPKTTTVQGSTLSPGAQIAVVSGVVGGLSVLFLIGALVVIAIFACGKKPVKKNYRKDSDTRINYQPKTRNKDSAEAVPAWISMIDSLKEQGYNPYFFNDYKSGKWSGERLHEA